MIESAAKKRVLFVGESITDVYHYGKALGKSSKESIICMERKSTEVFSGGVIAAAKHAETFCAKVEILSTVHLSKNRYIEQTHFRKLFEEYMGAELVPAPIWPDFSAYDAVVVLDYGHGMFTPDLIARICNGARFLAVNVQANAGNYGFSLATKWPRADYLCVDEVEARLATQNQHRPIKDSLILLAGRYESVAITLGKSGAIGCYENSAEAPAFTDRIVDTMGAGDAFFAVTAVMAEGADMGQLLRIGNAAAAIKCQIVGHRSYVTKAKLIAYLEAHGTR